MMKERKHVHERVNKTELWSKKTMTTREHSLTAKQSESQTEWEELLWRERHHSTGTKPPMLTRAKMTKMTAVNTALNTFGSNSNYLDAQMGYNKEKLDALDTGLGSLIDADLAKESARLEALKIRQQLGTQALGIANQTPQGLLSLFRG